MNNENLTPKDKIQIVTFIVVFLISMIVTSAFYIISDLKKQKIIEIKNKNFIYENNYSKQNNNFSPIKH